MKYSKSDDYLQPLSKSEGISWGEDRLHALLIPGIIDYSAVPQLPEIQGVMIGDHYRNQPQVYCVAGTQSEESQLRFQP